MLSYMCGGYLTLSNSFTLILPFSVIAKALILFLPCILLSIRCNNQMHFNYYIMYEGFTFLILNLFQYASGRINVSKVIKFVSTIC